LNEFGVAVVLLEVVAGQEGHVVAVADRDAPDAVELALVDPARVGEALVGQDRLHRAGGGRRRRLGREFSLVGAERVDLAHRGVDPVTLCAPYLTTVPP
jgi:hypothetical protein